MSNQEQTHTGDDIKLEIHPIFKFLEDSFFCFAAGQNMLAIPSFQELLVASHKGKMSEFSVSVDYEGSSVLKYDITYAFKRYNEISGLKQIERGVQGNINTLMIHQGRMTAITIFDVLQSSLYQSGLASSDLFKFSKHIRNGAAHNNKFNIVPPIIGEVVWRNKKIIQALHGTSVFGTFIYLSDLYILMVDLSRELFKIDKEEITS